MRKYLVKVSLLTLLLGVSIEVPAQKVAERKADTEYQNMAYIKAIDIYERIANKGYVNADIVKKLADAYYFNAKFIEANKWYSVLFEGEYQDKGKEPIASEYYYRYAQTLKSIEDYNKATKMLEQFAEIENNDSRARLYQANKDYLSKIQKQRELYDLQLLRNVNTKYSDYGATLLNKNLIFTSARKADNEKPIHPWTNEHFTALYSATLSDEGAFTEPVVYAKEISSMVNDATPVFTTDGKTMYFTRNNSNSKGKLKSTEEYASLKIFKALKTEKGLWEHVTALPFNSEDFNTAHPALTPDGKWLYFSSDRTGTMGQSDIFRVPIYPNGDFGAVENVGKTINTAGREGFPFISDDMFLFFASDGHPGLGGLDMYMVKLYDDGTFGEVTNMGMPVNSPFDDFGLYLDTNLHQGFVSSNRPGGVGGDDIYSFKEKPCRTAIQGIIYDRKTQEPIANATVTIMDALYQKQTNSRTDDQGHYLVQGIECGEKYRIKAEKVNFNTAELSFVTAYTSQINRMDIGLDRTLDTLKVEDDLFKKLKLNPIYFDFNKSEIRSDAVVELIQIVEVLQQYPRIKIDIRSHTDSRGKDAYNLKLSSDRARATVDWIVGKGISPDRIKGRGYGSTQPINECNKTVFCTEEQHALNRRSEFIVTEL
ncbi:OmpA family protein [Myroides odoratus]